jgi:hypothetical protein
VDDSLLMACGTVGQSLPLRRTGDFFDSEHDRTTFID